MSIENMEMEIKQAQATLGELLRSEYERIERMKQDTEVTDFSKKREDRDRHPARRRIETGPILKR